MIFREQARGLIEGGVDLLLIETSQDILEVKAAIVGIQQAFEETGNSLPIQAQVTLDTTGRMLLGTDITAVLAILEGMPIDVIGLNCSTGPDYMREPIRYLGENSTLPVSCIPNAGLPLNVDGQAVYPLETGTVCRITLTNLLRNSTSTWWAAAAGPPRAHLKVWWRKYAGSNPHPRLNITSPRLASATQASHAAGTAPFLIGER